MGLRWAAALLVIVSAVCAQDKKPAGPEKKAPDRVALDKGLAYLKDRVMDRRWDPVFDKPRQIRPNVTIASADRISYELVLYAFASGGVPEKDPAFQKLLRPALDDPLWQTYNVALLAMVLQKLDPLKYRPMIVRCAQFLVDSQCDNGQWSYGDGCRPAPAPKDLKEPIRIRRAGGFKAPGIGDNSNSQYAALGLRACHEAGLLFPDETITQGCSWWEKTQQADGAWAYDAVDKKGYASMTCGGIGAIAIFQTILKRDITKDPSIQKGLAWLDRNFSVARHPGKQEEKASAESQPLLWKFYYLYSLERAADLTSTDWIGEHHWHSDGAKELLRLQKPSGCWHDPSLEVGILDPTTSDIWDTCFAVLFLERATQPLIKSPSSKKP